MDEALREKLAGRTVVASVSGGKDSAAVSLWLTEQGIAHRRVFADTGWEHALTYAYLRGPLTEKLGAIDEVRAPAQMVDLIRHKGMFPSRKVRWCSEELKLKPIAEYLRALPDPISAVGIRADESKRRSGMAEWSRSEEYDCEIWLPIFRWTLADVLTIHKRHGLPLNPLYALGAKRVGCWPCIQASKGELRLVALNSPARVAEMEALEAEVSLARGARRGFFQNPLSRSGAPLPIREVVQWSLTGRGGRQFDLFAKQQATWTSCTGLGTCEAPESDTEAA